MFFVKIQLMWKILIILTAFYSKNAYSYDIPEPKVEILLPRGLRVSIPDTTGLSLLVFHGAVNRSLEGMRFGDFYGEVTQPTDGRWIYETMEVTLKTGDVLNFWANIKHNDEVYRLLGRSITVPDLLRSLQPEMNGNLINSTKPDFECIKANTRRRIPIQADRYKVTVCLSTSNP